MGEGGNKGVFHIIYNTFYVGTVNIIPLGNHVRDFSFDHLKLPHRF